MYVVIRKFSAMRSVPEAARRAESGIGQILKQSPGFVAYYVFDGGNGVGGSVTLFEDRGKANAANEKALAWIRGSLFDLIEGDSEIIAGEVLAEVLASRGRNRGEPQRTARRLRATTCGIARELRSKPRAVSEGGALAMTGRTSS